MLGHWRTPRSAPPRLLIVDSWFYDLLRSSSSPIAFASRAALLRKSAISASVALVCADVFSIYQLIHYSCYTATKIA